MPSITKPVYAIYSGQAYKPCGCCDICTDPALAYSDCGQPVLVEEPELPIQACA